MSARDQLGLVRLALKRGCALTINHLPRQHRPPLAAQNVFGQPRLVVDVDKQLPVFPFPKPRSANRRQTEAGLLGEVSTGMKSQREVEEFYISPNVIKQLRRGEAGLVVKHPSFCVDVVQLDYPKPARRVAFASVPRV